MKKILVLLPLVLLPLTGCSAIMDVVHSESESHFDDGGALFDSGVISATEATWLPTDASDITVRESTKNDVTATAVIGLPADAMRNNESSRIGGPPRVCSPSTVTCTKPSSSVGMPSTTVPLRMKLVSSGTVPGRSSDSPEQ